jgi:hypothetical protein
VVTELGVPELVITTSVSWSGKLPVVPLLMSALPLIARFPGGQVARALLGEAESLALAAEIWTKPLRPGSP